MRRARLPSSKAKVNRLAHLVQGRDRALILAHDNPDPDAMAGAMCLSHLVESLQLARPRIVYGGIIARAENRNMVRTLEVPVWSVEGIKFRPDDAFILVDTQPGFANNSLPEHAQVLAVIDHHDGTPQPALPFVDVRPGYGAVSSILTQYLVSAGVGIPPRLATAICYGITTETQDLGRQAHPADIAAFLEAFPLCDQTVLGRLRHPRHSIASFAELARAIQSARIVDGVVICHMGRLIAPDGAAETADLLASLEDVSWVLCTGVYEGRLVLSLRTTERGVNAGDLLRRVVGQEGQAGGHATIAGGAIDLADGADLAELEMAVTRGCLDELGRGTASELRPLAEQPGVPRQDTPAGGQEP